MEYPTSHLCFPGYSQTCPLSECVYEENISDKRNVPWYTTNKHFINFLYHAIEKTVANARAVHDGKVECNTVAYTSGFLSGQVL